MSDGTETDRRAAALAALEQWAPRGVLVVGNERVVPADGETRDVVDPSTGRSVHEAAEASAEDVGRAVGAASDALENGAWGRTSPADRGRRLRAIAAAIDRHSDTLALLESLDVGKPLSIAAGDVAYAAECFEYFGSLAVQIEGANRHFAEGLAVTRREPAGVVGIITPFNFPLALSAVKIATALAAGCTVVHKPSEHTPLSALALARLTRDQDLPAGAYNVVTGSGADAGGAIVRHPEVAKIVFTGSTEIGARVAADAARTIKRVTMELGGKSANIVCADADVAAASARSHTSYTLNAGQYCEAGSRLLVDRQLEDAVVEHLMRAAEGMIVGDALAPTSELGPLINEHAAERVAGMVERSEAAGARIATGGIRREDDAGAFFPPTVIAGAAPDSEIAQDEIFGPVVSVLPFVDVDEAVTLANGTRYGLAAGIQTADVGRAFRIAERLKVGTVWINDWATGSLAMPVGGRKQSGIGREHGPEGLDEYLEYKSILATWR
jgi:acyl-CoA reductase-like NAD-dependent aldehyde dehydrogenase